MRGRLHGPVSGPRRDLGSARRGPWRPLGRGPGPVSHAQGRRGPVTVTAVNRGVTRGVNSGVNSVINRGLNSGVNCRLRQVVCTGRAWVNGLGLQGRPWSMGATRASILIQEQNASYSQPSMGLTRQLKLGLYDPASALSPRRAGLVGPERLLRVGPIHSCGWGRSTLAGLLRADPLLRVGPIQAFEYAGAGGADPSPERIKVINSRV